MSILPGKLSQKPCVASANVAYMLLPNAKSVSNRSMSAGAMKEKSTFDEAWSFSPSVALWELLVNEYESGGVTYLFVGAFGVGLTHGIGLESAVVDDCVAHFSSFAGCYCEITVGLDVAVEYLHRLDLLAL